MNMESARSWKWVVGLLYIVAAVVLALVGRVSIFEAALLLGIGVILI